MSMFLAPDFPDRQFRVGKACLLWKTWDPKAPRQKRDINAVVSNERTTPICESAWNIFALMTAPFKTKKLILLI